MQTEMPRFAASELGLYYLHIHVSPKRGVRTKKGKLLVSSRKIKSRLLCTGTKFVFHAPVLTICCYVGTYLIIDDSGAGVQILVN